MEPRYGKSNLSIRPIRHVKEEWGLAQACDKAGLGSQPRRVFAALSNIRSMDVMLPTRSGLKFELAVSLRRRTTTKYSRKNFASNCPQK
jgi:hypothetical protein